MVSNSLVQSFFHTLVSKQNVPLNSLQQCKLIAQTLVHIFPFTSLHHLYAYWPDLLQCLHIDQIHIQHSEVDRVKIFTWLAAHVHWTCMFLIIAVHKCSLNVISAHSGANKPQYEVELTQTSAGSLGVYFFIVETPNSWCFILHHQFVTMLAKCMKHSHEFFLSIIILKESGWTYTEYHHITLKVSVVVMFHETIKHNNIVSYMKVCSNRRCIVQWVVQKVKLKYFSFQVTVGNFGEIDWWLFVRLLYLTTMKTALSKTPPPLSNSSTSSKSTATPSLTGILIIARHFDMPHCEAHCMLSKRLTVTNKL